MASQQSPQQILQAMGLGPAAARCYLILTECLPRAERVSFITSQSGQSSATTYRALDELIQKGFATKTRIIAATTYRALDPATAIDNYAAYLRRLVRPLTRDQR